MFDHPCQLPHAAAIALAVVVICVTDCLAPPELYTTEGARVTQCEPSTPSFPLSFPPFAVTVMPSGYVALAVDRAPQGGLLSSPSATGSRLKTTLTIGAYLVASPLPTLFFCIA
jgi:hypothetical protein